MKIRCIKSYYKNTLEKRETKKGVTEMLATLNSQTYINEIKDENLNLNAVIPVVKECADAIHFADFEKIVMDLRNVYSITTSGIGGILNIYHECEQKGIQFSLINLTPIVEETLEVTQVLSILEVE